jgi:uracil-DNA glycosylase family 4
VRGRGHRQVRAVATDPSGAQPPAAASCPTGPGVSSAQKPGPGSQPAAGAGIDRRTPPPAVAPARQASQLTIPGEAAFEDARALAAGAGTIAELRAALDGFTGCNLRHSAKTLVFADGNPEADVMFIGEAPGREEDLQGMPFVGRAGQLLDRMLAAIGLDRDTAYITNMIPWRPPGNRTPAAHEIELCRPFIERHITLAQPKVLVMLGNIASKSLLDTDKGILSVRGNWMDCKTGRPTDPLPCRPCIRPTCCATRRRSGWHGRISCRCRPGWKNSERVEILPKRRGVAEIFQ